MLDTSNIREYISWCTYKELRTINWLILIIKQVSVDEEDDDEDDDAAKVCADLGFFFLVIRYGTFQKWAEIWVNGYR